MNATKIFKLAPLPFLILTSLGQGLCQDKPKLSLHDSAKMDERTLGVAFQKFKKDCKRYPTTSEGIAALNICPPNLKKVWMGPYITRKTVKDPWGRSYIYEAQGQGYQLLSLGKDGNPGGNGEDRDVVDLVSK